MSPAKRTASAARTHSPDRPDSPAPAPAITEVGFTAGGLTPHLLVVDDDATIRHMLVSLLEREGYRVTASASATEALEAARDGMHLALIDLMLPDADGIDLLDQLIEINPSLDGIVLTGFGTIDHAVRATRRGAADFLTKPCQPEVVLHAVKRQLEIHYLKQENALLKKTVVKGGRIRVRDFEPAKLDVKPSEASPPAKNEYERGLAEGEQRAQASLAAQRTKEQALLAQAIRELERTTRSLTERMDTQSTALAFEIATKVVRDVAQEKRDLIGALVREALQRIKDQWQDGGLVTIKANPQDVPTLEQVREQLSEDGEAPAHVRIEPDPSISPGGCRVETATRVVDATLEAQLVRLGEALKQRSGRDYR